MKASEIMTKNVVTIRGSATVAEAVKLMRTNSLRSLIVERRSDEDAFGIVTDIDVVYKVVAYGRDPHQVRVFEIMTKPCIVVNPDLQVEYVARLFAQTGIHRAPVIQEGLLGIISITDILERGNFIEQPQELSLLESIDRARAEARATCQAKGPRSPECASAWDVVEELQAELAHQRAERLIKTHFEEYCEEVPEAKV